MHINASGEKVYDYTNLVDAVLSNDRNISNEKPIFIDADTEESVNFGDFKKLVRQGTAGFLDLGLRKGDCVCLYAPNSINYPSFILSTLAAGGSLSPANPMFTSYELEELLQLSKAKYLVAHPMNLDIALQAAKSVGIPTSRVWSISEDPKKRAPYWKTVLVKGNKEADPIKLTFEESKSAMTYLCFSSGTTGPPKGVMISHYNFIASNSETDNSLKSSNSHQNNGALLAVVPLFHILGIFRFIHLSIFEGRTTVIMQKYDLEQMCQCIQKYKVSAMYMVPPMLLHLYNFPQIVDKYDLSSVQGFYVGAAPVSKSLADQIEKKFNIPVLPGYGMTETSSVLTFSTVEYRKPGSVGRLLTGIDAKVVDENGKELPIGETGEICIKSAIVMQGYINNPTATAETIDKDGYLHTGDIGYCDTDGYWYIVDRSKELIKYNAFQIAPAELENVLLQCPLVADVAVIGVYDEKKQTEVPRAYVTLSPSGKMLGTEKAEEGIHKFVNEKVVQYKRLRGGIEFIDVVPKSVSGKILRKDLRELYKNQRKSNNKAKL